MTLRTALKSLQQRSSSTFCLIYWEEEDSLSVVKTSDVVDGSLSVGEQCTVKFSKELYPGKIVGIGSKTAMEELEENVMEGTVPLDGEASTSEQALPEGRDNSGQADSAKDSRHPDKDKETKAKKTSKKGTKKGQCGTDKENHPVSDTSAKVTRKRGRPKKENGPPKKKEKKAGNIIVIGADINEVPSSLPQTTQALTQAVSTTCTSSQPSNQNITTSQVLPTTSSQLSPITQTVTTTSQALSQALPTTSSQLSSITQIVTTATSFHQPSLTTTTTTTPSTPSSLPSSIIVPSSQPSFSQSSTSTTFELATQIDSPIQIQSPLQVSSTFTSDSQSSPTYSNTDPFLLEMTVEDLQERVTRLEDTQIKILDRLSSMESSLEKVLEQVQAPLQQHSRGHHQDIPPNPAQHQSIPPSPVRPVQHQSIPFSPFQHQSTCIPPSPAQRQSIPPSPFQHQSIPHSPAQCQNIPPSPAQHQSIPPSPAQHQSIPPSPAQHQNIPPSPAQHQSIPPSPAQHQSVPPSPAHHQSVPPSPVHHQSIPPSQTQHQSILHSPVYQQMLPCSLPSTSIQQHLQSALVPTCTNTTEKALPSSVINKSILSSPQVVVNKYSRFRGDSKAGTLSQKLAKEAFFGEEVMAQCTVFGCRDQPGLPTVELNQLKSTIHGLFPQYWTSPTEFESIWGSCVESIGQACKRLRKKKDKQRSYDLESTQ